MDAGARTRPGGEREIRLHTDVGLREADNAFNPKAVRNETRARAHADAEVLRQPRAVHGHLRDWFAAHRRAGRGVERRLRALEGTATRTERGNAIRDAATETLGFKETPRLFELDWPREVPELRAQGTTPTPTPRAMCATAASPPSGRGSTRPGERVTVFPKEPMQAGRTAGRSSLAGI